MNYVVRTIAFIGVIIATSTLIFAQQIPEKGNFYQQDIFHFNNPENDKMKFSSSAVEEESIYNEDFEGTVGSWSLSGSWQVGTPVSGPESGFESDNAAGTNLDGDYSSSADDWLISPVISLSGYEAGDEIKLRFNEWYIIESGYDYGRVKISVDGGSSWTEIATSNGSSDWRVTTVNLSDYKDEDVQIAFHLTSDGSVEHEGWFIDNFEVYAELAVPLAVNIQSLNSQNFPFIFMNVTVEYMGTGISTLDESNFEVCENDVTQTEFFEVIPPEESGGLRLADIVFIVDDTGSMGGEIASVRDNIIDFANALSASSIDYSLGLVTYKDDVNLFNGGALTSNINTFKGWIEGLVADGGSDTPENGFGAIEVAASELSYRPGSQKIFILITDAENHESDAGSHVVPTPKDLPEVVALLNDASITTYAVAIEHPQFLGEGSISEGTGGSFFYVTSPFTSILDDIAATVANNYVIRYQSSDTNLDGIQRDVCVEVNYEGESAVDYDSYIPGSVPVLNRTNSTIAYSDKAWSEGTPFEIEVEVKDEVDPFIETVTLYYKTTGTEEYTAVEMSTSDGELFSATIPSGFAAEPGIDYYITGSDGVSSGSTPKVNPAENPFQIPILPNEAPSISHTKITTWEAGVDIPVNAVVTDNTNELVSVKLYYRQVGQLSYTAINMSSGDGLDEFSGIIPGEVMTSAGVEYYIEAEDDVGTRSQAPGNHDNPGLITTGEDGLPLAEAPGIVSVQDVPFDQGGQVNITWQKSSSDVDVSELTHYSIWRAIPKEAMAKTMSFNPIGDIHQDFNGTAFAAATELNSDSLAWEWMSNQPALNLPLYAYTAKTLYDSTSKSDGMHYFMVVAHTSDPDNYTKSEPDSGYSVDNIAPATPMEASAVFSNEKVKVDWLNNTEEDFKRYHVYRGFKNSVSLDDFSLVASPRLNSYTDSEAPKDTTLYYLVLAEDLNENISETGEPISVQTHITVSNENVNAAPDKFDLSQNYPNPFNPSTQIKYSIPESGKVKMTVYDVLGRQVALLVNEVKAAGNYHVTFDASSLPSGLYIYSLKTEANSETRRMLLLK